MSPCARHLEYKIENFEIGRLLHLRSDIRNFKLDCVVGERSESNLRFRISGFEMQESSNFEILGQGLSSEKISTSGFMQRPPVVYNNRAFSSPRTGMRAPGRNPKRRYQSIP